MLFDPHKQTLDTGGREGAGCAVLHIDDPSHFHVSIELIIEEGLRKPPKFDLGIVDIDHKYFEEDLKRGSRFNRASYAFGFRDKMRVPNIGIPPMTGIERVESKNQDQRLPLHVYYQDGKLFYDVADCYEGDGQSGIGKVPYPKKIPHGNYRPFIS